MSEQKRATLSTISTQKPNVKKVKEVSKTVRFTLTLPESNEKACPEYNYRDLLNSFEVSYNRKWLLFALGDLLTTWSIITRVPNAFAYVVHVWIFGLELHTNRDAHVSKFRYYLFLMGVLFVQAAVFSLIICQKSTSRHICV